MAYVSDDPNFTEERYNAVYRKGDTTGKSQITLLTI